MINLNVVTQSDIDLNAGLFYKLFVISIRDMSQRLSVCDISKYNNLSVSLNQNYCYFSYISDKALNSY